MHEEVIPYSLPELGRGFRGDILRSYGSRKSDHSEHEKKRPVKEYPSVIPRLDTAVDKRSYDKRNQKLEYGFQHLECGREYALFSIWF